MGTCSSAQKKKDCTAKASKEVCIPSFIKEKAFNEEKPLEFGSKEESFFDSKVWIDSDFEDEFLSVNGDFTPSQCSTPNYESIKLMTPKKSMSSENVISSKLEPSPTGRKKLAELLRETSQGEEHESDANGYQNSNFKLVKSSLKGDAYGYGDGSVASFCLPSLVKANCFSEKRKMDHLHCCS